MRGPARDDDRLPRAHLADDAVDRVRQHALGTRRFEDLKKTLRMVVAKSGAGSAED